MLKTLQAGRALAALSVVAFHLSLMMSVPRYGGQAVFQQYTSRGHLGVDFFFVLSGFVILLAHANDVGRPEQWGRFVYRRFVRLFPTYWLYTGAFVLLVALGLGTQASPSPGVMDVLAFTTLLKLTPSSPPISVAWSLFHEVAFYAVFSILILHKRIGIAALAIWCVVCLSFFHFTRSFEVYTSAFNLYFLVGMAAHFVFKQPGAGLLPALAGLTLLAMTLAGLPPEHVGSRLLTVGGLTLLLIGLAKLERRGHIKVPAMLTFLGDASYSIYLTHLAFAGVLLKLLTKSGLQSSIGGWGIYLVVFAGTVGLACLAYALVERPLLELLRNPRTRDNLQGSSLTAAPAGRKLRARPRILGGARQARTRGFAQPGRQAAGQAQQSRPPVAG